MPLLLSRNDITKLRCDAIVLPANEHLLQGRGTSRAIFLAAGEEELTAACRKIGHCPVGSAVMTEGFHLPVKAIIHAVCPRWRGGEQGEADLLYRAYQESLQLACEAGCTSVAFPLLSAGSYGYPKAGALNVANHAITDFLMDHDMDVELVFYDRESLAAGRSIFREIREYIDDNYVGAKDESYTNLSVSALETFADALDRRKRADSDEEFHGEESDDDFLSGARWVAEESGPDLTDTLQLSEEEVASIRQEAAGMPGAWVPTGDEAASIRQEAVGMPAAAAAKGGKGSLKDRIKSLLKGDSENFHDMLFRLIDESGMTYPQVYNRANMSKKLFSKIKLNPDSTPKKKNILALAIALKLDMDQTEELLMKAGYALSNSSMADVIISYFIEKRIFDVFEINEALFEYGLENELLGF